MIETQIREGFDEGERGRVGELYWAAFGDKLATAFADRSIGRAVITAALRSDRTYVARAAGEVVGVCGFYEGGQGAVDLTWRLLRRHVSVVAAAWGLAALALLERGERPGVLVLDGICVSPEHRGRGIGSRLLAAATERAASQGCSAVQLSVIDDNPRAAALYRRSGFVPVARGDLGPLRHLYGFNGHTTMRKEVGPRAC